MVVGTDKAVKIGSGRHTALLKLSPEGDSGNTAVNKVANGLAQKTLQVARGIRDLRGGADTLLVVLRPSLLKVTRIGGTGIA